MRRPSILLLLLASACTSSAAEDSTPASDDANLTAGTSFTTCGPYGATANVLYASDGKSAAYVTCPANASDPSVLRRMDLVSHATTDVATFDEPVFVRSNDGGKHFYVLDDHTQTLHLYAWDGSPEVTVADAASFVMSPDGTRIVTYAQKRLPIGQYQNVYHLDVRVRSLDGALDASGSFQEDRGGNYVNGDANVRDVVFAPDGSHVGFVREYADASVDVFVSKFDLATKQFSDGTHFGWVTQTFPETYDGTTMAVVKAEYDGTRSFSAGTYSTRLVNVDTQSYLGVYCAARAGSGLVFLAAQADYGQPVSLLRWDAASGASTIATFASGAAEKPAACPVVAPSGTFATYKSSSNGRAAVVALAAGSTAHVLAATTPYDPLALKPGADRLLAFPSYDRAQIVDPATGAATDVSFAAIDGVRLFSGYSALLPNGRIVAIGSKAIDPVHLKYEETVWTSTGGAFTQAAKLATEQDGYLTIVPLGGDKGFAVEHEDFDHQHTIMTILE